MRNSVRAFDGLLSDPDLHTVWSDRHYILGLLLAEPERNPRQGIARRHHRVDYDHAYVFDQRRSTENLVRQVHRCLPGNLLRDGLR